MAHDAAVIAPVDQSVANKSLICMKLTEDAFGDPAAMAVSRGK
jgi:hypothetical protein